MKIVSISSEVSPFSKSGGLADVVKSLSSSLHDLGHDVSIITPLYGKIIDKNKHNLKLICKNFKFRLDKNTLIEVNFWQGRIKEGLPVFFIENKKYFSRKKDLYGSERENARFLLFDKAALHLIMSLKLDPDIIHCHDWQAGLIPYFLRKDKDFKSVKKAKTVFTIHNIIFQLGQNWWEIPPEKKDYGKRKIPQITDPDIENINFTKRAILTSDAINTVSEHYREEIMTRHIGQDLHRILKNRRDKLFGIVNGIDYHAYNPSSDPGLRARYSYKKIHRKKLNKEYLQKKFGLPANINTPLFCTTSRVTFQKGFELILNILGHLMPLDIQLIIIGAGDKNYIKKLQKIAKKYPHKLIVIPSHKENQKYETLVYAGSDFFLLPSHHEPCGINQLIAMRYGCIPIIRRIGGLYDTVENFDSASRTGTGFSFHRFSEFSLYGAIVRALEVYKQKQVFRNMMAQAMKQSSDWKIPAQKYENLFQKTIKQ